MLRRSLTPLTLVVTFIVTLTVIFFIVGSRGPLTQVAQESDVGQAEVTAEATEDAETTPEVEITEDPSPTMTPSTISCL